MENLSIMPISYNFKTRLYPVLDKIINHYKTPFHIYDEKGIRETGAKLISAFKNLDFREYFAVKALPNPHIMEIMRNMGFGFDCSSISELILSRKIGAFSDDIMFTSNNTSRYEFEFAKKNGGSILNLDDITLIDKLDKMPELICFRYNPGVARSGNSIIGKPEEAKYGLTKKQMFEAYEISKKKGAQRFGIHTMLISNELSYEYMVDTAKMLLDLIEEITAKLGIKFEFINLGGGIGIPYKLEQKPFNIKAMGHEVTSLFNDFKSKNGYLPKLFIESGRYMTGPHGVFVSKVINLKDTYRKYIGVDASMSGLMRPAIYGAYHHIEVLGKENPAETEMVDVVGSLCENNDKFAIQRELPKIDIGDILIMQDSGAHGHAMGFNYNGKLRPKELLLRENGSVELIRREETLDDYFATLNFTQNVL
jgi:diaminopimelate decarboxylase